MRFHEKKAAVNFRLAEDKDVDALIALARTAYLETYSTVFTEAKVNKIFGDEYRSELPKEFKSPFIRYLLAFNDNKLVGYAKIIIKEGEIASLDKLYLLNEYQGKGIGAQLVKQCRHIAENLGCSHLELLVWEQNKSAIQFYEHMGFELSGEPVELKFDGDTFYDLPMRAPIVPDATLSPSASR